MSKYEPYYRGASFNGFESLLTPGENVLWEGKPKKSAFVLNKIMVMAPFALMWLLIDGGVMMSIFSADTDGTPWMFIVPFFLFHMMPVWIWIGQIISAGRRWRNTHYAVTDRRIIIQNGFIGMEYQTLYYKDIQNVRLHIGVIDRLTGVGDIYFDCASLPYVAYQRSVRGRTAGNAQCFLDIPEAQQIYPMLQKTVMDMQADVLFPNDLRPEENHGYHTQYRG